MSVGAKDSITLLRLIVGIVALKVFLSDLHANSQTVMSSMLI